MCMEDIRIARKTRTRVIDLTLDTTAAQVLPYNPNRYALWIGNTSTGSAHFSLGTAPAQGRGITQGASAQPVFFRLVLEGDSVRQPLYAVASAAAVRITLVETELADQ